MNIKDFFTNFFRMRATSKIRVEMGSLKFVEDNTTANYELMRNVYKNVDKDFKLGAGFAAPVINATAGFMGVPGLTAEDEEAQAILDDFMLNNTSKIMQSIVDALKLGDEYIWLTREERPDPLYPEKTTGRLIYNRIPPEEVKYIRRNPLTKEVIAYFLESEHSWKEDNAEKKCTIKQTIGYDEEIGKAYRKIEIDGDKPQGVQEGEKFLPWNFLPIVHIKNKEEIGHTNGQSEIENIIPYIRAYHDVMLAALKGNKLHSTPILQVYGDIDGFIERNFSGEKNANGEYVVDMQGKEILFFHNKDTEGAEFVEVKSATGDAKELLKFLFYCIVDASETPEFLFGVHTPAALASVKEQMPILINKIRRKREQFTEAFERLARMALVMESQGSGKQLSSAGVTIGWDVIDPRDTSEIAETLDKTVNALSKAVTSNLMSEEAAVNYLARIVETMQEYSSDDPELIGEREKIAATRRLRMRYSDTSGWRDDLEMLEKKRKGES